MGADRSLCTVANCFTELIAYVFFLKKVCARRQPDYADVDARIESLVEESARRMRECGLDPRDYDDGRFAAFAWVDETLLNMPWSHREEWRRSLLQTRHYGTTNAGEEFFERLNRLRSEERSVREVYYLCLSLGFRGRYHNDGDEFLLDQLRKSNLKSLTGLVTPVKAYATEPAFPGSYETKLGGAARGRGGRFWTATRVLLTVAPPVFLVLLYAVFSFVLNGVVENVTVHVGPG